MSTVDHGGILSAEHKVQGVAMLSLDGSAACVEDNCIDESACHLLWGGPCEKKS